MKEKAGWREEKDHEVRSVPRRGKAKNNSLIIHIPGFEVCDSELLTKTGRLCSFIRADSK